MIRLHCLITNLTKQVHLGGHMAEGKMGSVGLEQPNQLLLPYEHPQQMNNIYYPSNYISHIFKFFSFYIT
jgi:hypothetical protein